MQAMVRLSQPISDEDLERISVENPGWQVERESDGSLVMSPTTSLGSAKNIELARQLANFARSYGGKAFDSSAGFTLPDHSALSPNGAWMQTERWADLPRKVQDSYAPLVPDLWIELRSKTDSLKKLQKKPRRIQGFGAGYVLLIDPYERTSWASGQPPANFALDLEAIFDA